MFLETIVRFAKSVIDKLVKINCKCHVGVRTVNNTSIIGYQSKGGYLASSTEDQSPIAMHQLWQMTSWKFALTSQVFVVIRVYQNLTGNLRQDGPKAKGKTAIWVQQLTLPSTVTWTNIILELL